MDAYLRRGVAVRAPVTVIDYGAGNIWSVLSALRHLEMTSSVTSDPNEVSRADTLLLPGVGSFRKAMNTLRATGLDQAIVEAVRKRGSPILGVCLGMQLLGASSTEDGDTLGLGLVPNVVERFSGDEVGDRKVPHMGFNTVSCDNRTGLFRDLPQRADFYFVHSYRMLPEALAGNIATCDYGVSFLAGFEIDNVSGTQFHPEKSQTNGLKLLSNFLQS